MCVDPQDRAGWSSRDRELAEIRVGAPTAADGVRTEIQNSWQRCLMTGITPEFDDIPYSTDLPENSRLRRAAAPVVNRLAEQLADSPATVLLADSNARIVDRLAGRRSILSKLDNANVAPGFQYAEDCTGTNGIGTALEERRLFSVRGGEHFRESLQNLACVGKPIVHPISRGVEGILDLTCSVRDANSFMTPLVEAAVREIEQRLHDMASQDEQALLEEFLRTSRRVNAAVVTLSSDLVLANPAAIRLLQPADQTLLWNRALLRLADRDEFAGTVHLADSTEVTAKVRRLGDGRRTWGIVVELRVKADLREGESPSRFPAPARRLASSAGQAGITGRSTASRRLDGELDLVARDAGPTLITGDSGVGKRYATRALHARWSGAEENIVEHDLAMVESQDVRDWIQRLRDHLAVGATVLLRHAEVVDGRVAAPLGSVIEEADQQRWKVVVTGPDQVPDAAHRLYAHFRRRLSVAPLSRRGDEVEDIVRDVLAGLRPGRSPQRLQAAALQSLMSRSWPGNVRELESVISSAATRALGGDIGLQHLPAGYRQSPAKVTSSLERAELDALLTTLEQSRGNKSLAAKKLGVARSTLYRKVREYGIDVDRFVIT